MVTNKLERQILLKEINKNHDGGLFAAVAGWITKNSKQKIVLKGSAEQVAAVQSAMLSTKNFHESLQNPAANLNVIAEALQKKHDSAENFERTFGISWVL